MIMRCFIFNNKHEFPILGWSTSPLPNLPSTCCSAKHKFDLKISKEFGKLRIRLGFCFFSLQKLSVFNAVSKVSSRVPPSQIIEFVRTIWISCDILHGFTSEWFWKQLISFFHCIAWTFLWTIYIYTYIHIFKNLCVWKYNCFFKYLLVKEFECTFGQIYWCQDYIFFFKISAVNPGL